MKYLMLVLFLSVCGCTARDGVVVEVGSVIGGETVLTEIEEISADSQTLEEQQIQFDELVNPLLTKVEKFLDRSVPIDIRTKKQSKEEAFIQGSSLALQSVHTEWNRMRAAVDFLRRVSEDRSIHIINMKSSVQFAAGKIPAKAREVIAAAKNSKKKQKKVAEIREAELAVEELESFLREKGIPLIP